MPRVPVTPPGGPTTATGGGGAVTTIGPGLFGKLPAVGDYVRHAVPRDVIGALDERLSAAIDLGRRRHGADWPSRFALAPPWRFAIPVPRRGGLVAIGVVSASRDRVGRPYPLVLLGGLPEGTPTAVAPFACDDWFAALELVAMAAVTGGMGATQLAAEVTALGQPKPDPTFDIPLCRRLLAEYTGETDFAQGLWWTFGAEEGEACLIDWPDLPPVDRLTAMFDGGWRSWITTAAPSASPPSSDPP